MRTQPAAPQQRNLLTSTVLFIPVLLCCSSLRAQEAVNAVLFGTVTDISGAPIPGATLTAKNVGTGITIERTSDQSGEYLFPSLAPGHYTLEAAKAGFSTKQVSGLTLQVNQQARLDVQLNVGSVTTVVEVRGTAALVETSTASVGTVVGEREVEDFPLNLRYVEALATLVPGTAPDSPSGYAAGSGQIAIGGSPFGTINYTAGGGRDASNTLLIDGMESRSWSTGGIALEPPPDATEEFKIQTNIYSAEFGKTAGSTMNLVTKSGTNRLHGDAYEFFRNDKLDARNFFAVNQVNPATGREIPGSARPEFRRNNYGGTLGGPIQKDKTFVFGYYDGLRQIQGLSFPNVVPTPAERSGNFSSALTGQTINLCGSGGPASLNFDSGQLFYPASESLYTCPAGSASAGSTVLVGQPVPGNVITNIDPVGQKVVAGFPLPNRAGYPNFINQNPLVRNDSQFGLRVDRSFGEHDRIFARYLFAQSSFLDPGSGYTTLPGFGDTIYFRGQNMATGWTHTFGAALLNEVHLGFQRNDPLTQCQACPRPAGFEENFGIKNLTAPNPSLEGFPFFSFSNFSGVGDSNYRPTLSLEQTGDYGDNLTWTHGRHTVVVGGDFQWWQNLPWESPYSPHGQFTENGQYSSLAGELPGTSGASDLADLELGYTALGARSVQYKDSNFVGGTFLSWFGQDDIRFSPNLSLNLGLRYEFRGPPVDRYNNIVTFHPTGPEFSGPGNALLVTAAPASVNDTLCTDGQHPNLISASGECLVASSQQRASFGFTGRAQQALIFPNHDDFAPRLGIAWRPTRSDKLVIRTGIGIFYDLGNMNMWQYVDDNPVFSPTGIFNTAFGAPPPLTNGVPTTIEESFAGSGIPPLSQQYASLYPVTNFQPPRVLEWSFGAQSQLSRDMALEVDYVGNQAHHLDIYHAFGNQPEPGTGALQPRRPYPDYNILAIFTSDGDSNYNALQVKFTRRFSGGVSFLTSYTWSKARDDSEGIENQAGSQYAQDDNNIRGNWAIAAGNIPQRFVFSPIWELPVGRGKRFLDEAGLGSRILGGWEVSGILTLQSGFPFTVLAPQDFSNTGSTSPRPDRTCSGAGPQTVAEWLNVNCFTTTFLGSALAAGQPRFGNSGRNILVGPPLRNLDLALIRNFALTERFKLEFRGEAFNLFNTAPFGLPNSTVGTTGFGALTSAGEARDLQFALKLAF